MTDFVRTDHFTVLFTLSEMKNEVARPMDGGGSICAGESACIGAVFAQYPQTVGREVQKSSSRVQWKNRCFNSLSLTYNREPEHTNGCRDEGKINVKPLKRSSNSVVAFVDAVGTYGEPVKYFCH